LLRYLFLCSLFSFFSLLTGSYSNRPGLNTSCPLCPMGKVAAEPGTIECTSCVEPQFINREGGLIWYV
jgi:hypothetical protein